MGILLGCEFPSEVGKPRFWTFPRSAFFHGPLTHELCYRARKIADAIQSIDPFQPRDAKSHESRLLESELAVAENTERNDLARYLCAGFHACKSREWAFDRILATVGPDPGAPWRSVADLAMAAEARQTTLQ